MFNAQCLLSNVEYAFLVGLHLGGMVAHAQAQTGWKTQTQKGVPAGTACTSIRTRYALAGSRRSRVLSVGARFRFYPSKNVFIRLNTFIALI